MSLSPIGNVYYCCIMLIFVVVFAFAAYVKNMLIIMYYNCCYSHISQLLEMTCQVANLLKRDGVKKGDRVAIYMPVSPLLVASMLACARIGAIHRSVEVLNAQFYTFHLRIHTCMFSFRYYSGAFVSFVKFIIAVVKTVM